ncbi:MAG: hypothetical protein ABFQ65_04665 [Nanoarchaeota archaeon]
MDLPDNVSLVGVQKDDDIMVDLELCHEKKICVFCHNPHAVLENMSNGEEGPNLCICHNCLNKMKVFRKEVEHFLNEKD